MDYAAHMEAIKKDDLDMFRNFKSRCKPQLEIFYKEAEKYFQQLERYKKTGEFSPVHFSILNENRSSLKENEEPQEENTDNEDSEQNLPKTRGGRIPLREAKNSIKPNDLFQIKKEKLSIMNSESAREDCESMPITKIKKEAAEEMLPPSMIPPRTRRIKTERPSQPVTRTTRTKTRKDQEAMREESSKRKDSDIIIEKTPIPTIELTDDEDGNVDSTIKSVKSTRAATNAEAETTRSTRTKTRRDAKVAEEIPVETRSTRTKTRAQKKRARDADTDDEQVVQTEKKRSLSNSRPAARTSSRGKAAQLNTSGQTEYEDAVSTLETETEPIKENTNTTYIAKDKKPRVLNETMVIDKPSTNIMNSTVVVPNPKIVTNTQDLVTDDESYEQIKTKQTAKTKPLFSPFKSSPVKKKVEAFEKWGTEQSSSASRIPRSDKKSNEKSKMYTPMGSRFMPTVNSTNKVNKFLTPQANLSSSGLKASQTEYRERERKRMEKEQEALKKREAILQAQTEDKRKKREEKQLKVQQQREALEKEKQRLYELQKQKDERAKQLKAEKLQKQREELEKERILNKEKAIQSLRKKEETLKTQEIHNRQFPQYMVTKAPPLPTEDCYDSDDEKYRGLKINTPSWATASALRKGQKIMFASGEKLKNTFYCCQARTVDLRDIFEVIDPRKLKRTSSAIWRKPPRYTLMPNMPEFDEQDESD